MTHYIKSEPIPMVRPIRINASERLSPERLVSSKQLAYMPKHYSGITFTPEYGKPYVVWFNGYICIYAKSRAEAETAYKRIAKGEG